MRTKEQLREYGRAWYIRNRERTIAKNQAWVAAHRDKVKEYQDRYRANNRQTRLESQRKWRDKNQHRLPAMRRSGMLRKLYGLTIDSYNALLLKQGGKCAICETIILPGNKSAIDHDHDTGEVRGILCTQCNTGLGNFKESIALLHWAANYLSGGQLVKLWERGAA